MMYYKDGSHLHPQAHKQINNKTYIRKGHP
jgi:hypothetical protein